MSNILDSQELINGNTQQELADRWWRQTSSTPDNVNPFITDDSRAPRGRRGSVERHQNFQSESPNGVSFLGGIVSGAIESPAVRTIVAEPDTVYFAPFGNQLADNTTEDFSPDSDFPGGYALTPQHLDDLDPPLNPRDPSSLFEQENVSLPTLLDVARFVADNFITGQFVEIDGEDVTLSNIEDFRQETQNLPYSELPRHTGARSGDPEKTFLADPDLGENLDNEDPFDDKFPTLAEIKNSSSEEFVVPFVQAGDYFGFELDSDAHTVQFGATGFGQDVTYNILNPVEGSNDNDNLNGTEGNDYIDGKNGKDTLTGLGGDDLMLGGNDKDTIDGGIGDDELWGEEGNDVFIYGSGYEKDKIFDFEPGEIIKLVRFEEFDEEEFEDSIIDITLPSGVNAAQITFNDKDILHIVGVSKNDLEIDDGKITFND